MSHEELDRFEHMMKSMIEQNEATIKAVVASNDASNQIVLYKLDQMEINQNNIITAVNKTNGSVAKVITEQFEIKREQELLRQEQTNAPMKHVAVCPNVKKIADLEKESFSKAEMKKMIYQNVGILGVIIGIIFSVYKLLGGN